MTRPLNPVQQVILDCLARAALHTFGPARECQYPFGEPGDADFRFCGEKSAPGVSYCAKHRRIVYRRAGNLYAVVPLPSENRRRTPDDPGDAGAWDERENQRHA